MLSSDMSMHCVLLLHQENDSQVRKKGETASATLALTLVERLNLGRDIQSREQQDDMKVEIGDRRRALVTFFKFNICPHRRRLVQHIMLPIALARVNAEVPKLQVSPRLLTLDLWASTLGNDLENLSSKYPCSGRYVTADGAWNFPDNCLLSA